MSWVRGFFAGFFLLSIFFPHFALHHSVSPKGILNSHLVDRNVIVGIRDLSLAGGCEQQHLRAPDTAAKSHK